MFYFLVAMGVAFGSVFVLSFLGYLLSEDKDSKVKIVVGLVASVVYGLILWWAFWASQVGFYGPLPLFLPIIFGAVIAGFISGYTEDDFQFRTISPAVTVFAGYILYALIFVLIANSNMMQSKGRASLVGDVKMVTNLNEAMAPADNAHICQVSKEIAATYAQNALSQIKLKDGVIPGSRYSIGEPTKQIVEGRYYWIFPLEFQGYFKWSQDSQVPGYLRVSAEDPTASAQAIQTDKNGNEIHIKYLKSACFDFKAERYLRMNGYMNAILDDWTYEVDDNWRPYYTVTVLERKFGLDGNQAAGIVLLDLQTGDVNFYKLTDVPKWVDRSIPLGSVIDPNVKSWGMYSNCNWSYTFFHDDKSQKPTEGWFMTYGVQGDCQWFTGFTSMNNKDNALTGFMITDAKTGKSIFYKASGVTENLAIAAAKTMWANFPGYETTELAPYNIYGYLTYVIPMQSNNQFVGISLVSLNVNIKASGKTLEEALRNYRDAITSSGGNGLAPQSGKSKTVELKGTIERIGLPLVSSKSTIFTFKLNGVGKIFQVSYTDANPKPIVMKEGDSVVLTYEETTEVSVNVTTFDIPAVALEKGSVTQSRYVDNKQQLDKEAARVDDQKKVDDLIGSDQMKKVSPDDLQKFLDEQAAKK